MSPVATVHGPTAAATGRIERSVVPLSTLRKGASATLHAMALDAEDAAYMAALGLTDGCPLRVCRPGEPCIVQVRTTRIGLSACVARQLLVVPITDRGVAEDLHSAPELHVC